MAEAPSGARASHLVKDEAERAADAEEARSEEQLRASGRRDERRTKQERCWARTRDGEQGQESEDGRAESEDTAHEGTAELGAGNKRGGSSDCCAQREVGEQALHGVHTQQLELLHASAAVGCVEWSGEADSACCGG